MSSFLHSHSSPVKYCIPLSFILHFRCMVYWFWCNQTYDWCIYSSLWLSSCQILLSIFFRISRQSGWLEAFYLDFAPIYAHDNFSLHYRFSSGIVCLLTHLNPLWSVKSGALVTYFLCLVKHVNLGNTVVSFQSSIISWVSKPLGLSHWCLKSFSHCVK